MENISANPKVTVIVANYNTAQFLESCLDSLCSQTYKDFEVLVIDDGSTDNSVDIINRYIQHDRRFRLIKLSRNHGVTYARHVALPQCKGEYIAILDSDDIALPRRLEKQVLFLDANPEVVLLGSYYEIINTKGDIRSGRRSVPITDVEIRWRVTFGNCLIHSSIMYRKEAAINCGGYDRAVLVAEDADFYSRIIRIGKAAAIPEVLIQWRSHEKSMTKYTEQVEIDKYSLIILQKAVCSLTSQWVGTEVAEAVFYNTKNPAKNSAFFKEGMGMLIQVFNLFHASQTSGSSLSRKRLSGCLLKHLLKIHKRNRKESWWKEGQEAWLQTVRTLIFQYNYRWYADWYQFRYKLKLLPYLWRLM
ncbi:MAG: glycosyltransferase family 2 protein [Desulfobacteraceae bacterium]|nr:glycosyltransferase family 2 protein [Desulfobacteraceae bacterium]MBU4055870.1 glycosyltransferase [Pseudomonadota bacterium]